MGAFKWIRMCNSVFILVTLCLTSLVLGENISGDKENGCTFADKRRGVCKPSSECPDKSTDSFGCDNQGDIIYVCCEPTANVSASNASAGRTESTSQEHNGPSRTENGTKDDEIQERFFDDFPIFQVAGDNQNKGGRNPENHRYHYNYNFRHSYNNGRRNSYRDRDEYSFDTTPGYDLQHSSKKWEENKDQRNAGYPCETNRRITERPYNSGYSNYEEEENPWNSNRRTTERPYNPGYYEENPWNSNRRTTGRPYNPGYNNYEEENPWNSNRRTTERPYNPGYYEENSWNSNRRTTERPYNLGYINYEENSWNSNRRTTERPYNPGYTNNEEEKPWNSNRRPAERPYNPGYINYEEEEKPWNSNRRTTERPYNPGYINYEEEEKPWNSNRRTTERPYNPGYINYEEEEKPWNSNRRTTDRPRPTRTTESSNKGQKPVSNNLSNYPNKNRKRISEIKCEEYSKIVTQTISGLPLLPNPSPIEIKVDECKKYLVHQLIVGGKNTTVGEFPHMVALAFPDTESGKPRWACGGSLISEQYVLTAAHCVFTNYGKPTKVRLGEYNLESDDDGAHPEDYLIDEVIAHPDYKRSEKYNDIALLKLSRRVNIRKDIRPACLNTKYTLRETKATALGWGRVGRAENQSSVLLKVSLNIIDKAYCGKVYSAANSRGQLPLGIIDTQLCAGELAGKKDTCQGDSGGPLEVLSESNRCIHYIIGITSFGKSCGAEYSPGVYTRVSSYISWIENIVWPGQ